MTRGGPVGHGGRDRLDGLDWYPAPVDAQVAGKLAARFTEAFGREPDGVWAAPGRVNVIGEHVDYNGGLCLPFALPHRTYVAAARRDDDLIRVRDARGSADTVEVALAEVGPGRVPGWGGYVAGVPWAMREDGLPACGVDLLIDGWVPRGSGLSSSAALECSVAVALDDLLELGLSSTDAGRARLAAACMRAENEIAGAPTGGLDQAASLRCRPGEALLLDCRDFSTEQVPLDLAADGLELLVMDTRVHHAHVDGGYGDRRRGCEQAAELLGVAVLGELDVAQLDSGEVARRLSEAAGAPRAGELLPLVRHVLREIARVRSVVELLRAGRTRDCGPLLTASHESLRDDYRVSCAELDVACAAAVDAGALGARMTGGGFGGSAIALVAAEQAQTVAAAVTQAFVAAGYERPGFLAAVPSAPAGRVC